MPTLIEIGAPVNLLDSVAAEAGEGESFATPILAALYSVQISFSEEPDAVSINIQGSNDGLTWSDIVSSTETAGEILTFLVGTLFLRAKIQSITAGEFVTVVLSARPNFANQSLNTTSSPTFVQVNASRLNLQKDGYGVIVDLDQSVGDGQVLSLFSNGNGYGLAHYDGSPDSFDSNKYLQTFLSGATARIYVGDGITLFKVGYISKSEINFTPDTVTLKASNLEDGTLDIRVGTIKLGGVDLFNDNIVIPGVGTIIVSQGFISAFTPE